MVTGYGAHSKCLLKADIEGSEWEVIDRTPSDKLACFSQIVCEFHLLHRISEGDFFEMATRVFGKLNTTHQSVHVHANNAGPIANVSNLVVPTIIEVTYARRGTYNFLPSDELFPTMLDAPNIETAPDIYLGGMRF